MRESLCKRLIEDPNLKTLALRLFDKDAEDLIQDMAVIICEKSDEELIKLDEYFNFWAARMIMNMASKTGKLGKVRHRHKHLEHNELIGFEYDPIIDEKYQEAMGIIDEMYWYKRDLFLTYVDKGSLSKVTDATAKDGIKGIPRSSVRLVVKEVITTVNNRMK